MAESRAPAAPRLALMGTEAVKEATATTMTMITERIPVKVKSICLIGGDGAGGAGNPAHLAAFVNPPEGFDFSSAEGAKPTQAWELVREAVAGGVEYPTRYTLFKNVTSLALFVDRNFGADATVVQYLGLKGEFTRYRREAVVTTYEARPLAGDHKGAEEQKPSMDLA
ncbi:hypothetical protein I4F81_002965 [Pyropia yezoensis]|uniref:Uncharacterized protein n=1 Tax=Pyropia yezoensis TaxID=2788 RepID=A0ACC3BSH6_PYRYE|nr:hypothetical protein I4F81_002965 [Neopyropia yezoensis]